MILELRQTVCNELEELLQSHCVLLINRQSIMSYLGFISVKSSL